MLEAPEEGSVGWSHWKVRNREKNRVSQVGRKLGAKAERQLVRGLFREHLGNQLAEEV